MSDVHPVCATLLVLLERQLAGDDSVREEISGIFSRFRGDYPDDDPSLSRELFQDVKHVLYEWHQMFSWQPGRPEGLPVLVTLLRRVCRKTEDDSFALYRSEEWGRLVALRGPVEAVLISECARCTRRYTAMGTSGFSDLTGLVCDWCGFAVFVSSWEDRREAPCPCGGTAVRGCPACGAQEGPVVDEMSGYRYFADHGFRRED